MNHVEIVPYDSCFRDTVRRCVFDTGYGGADVAPFFSDRELFADLLTLYYTDYEPGHAYIGMVDGEPAGYLLGCADTAHCNEVMKKHVFPSILRRLVRGEYNIDRVTARYLWRGVLAMIRGEEKPAPLEQFPAHLHIDLFEPYRRHGLGSRLIHTWLDTLQDLGVPGIHLGSSSAHTQSHAFYEKLGFRRYGVYRFTDSFFFERDQRDLYGICYVMDLHVKKRSAAGV